MTDSVELRPLGVGEILDVALKIVWRNAGTLLRVVVFIVLPVQIVIALIEASATPSRLNRAGTFTGTGGNTTTIHDVYAYLGALFVVLVLSLVSSILSSGACYRAVATAYLGERTGWRESLAFALRRVHSLLWVTFLTTLIGVLGLFLCVIPGVYFWVAFALAVPVLMTEELRGKAALGRSRSLVRGSWWRVFGVLLLGYILSGILSTAISALLIGVTTVQAGQASVVGVIVSIVAGTLSKLVTVPFVAAFVTVLYFDLRVRREAFDLQLVAQRIGVEPPPGTILVAPPPPPSSSEQPPFWPPPPGWKPGGTDA
jgi:hypothetical protein